MEKLYDFIRAYYSEYFVAAKFGSLSSWCRYCFSICIKCVCIGLKLNKIKFSSLKKSLQEEEKNILITGLSIQLLDLTDVSIFLLDL